MIYYHVTRKDAFLNSIRYEGLVPRIGNRSILLNEKPGIFLFPTVEDMEYALSNWLGEILEEEGDDVEFVSLKVMLLDSFPLESPVEYERISRIPIPPHRIKYFRDE
jgi:hypothetical protein